MSTRSFRTTRSHNLSKNCSEYFRFSAKEFPHYAAMASGRFLFAMALSCAVAPYGVSEKEGVEWAREMECTPSKERKRENTPGGALEGWWSRFLVPLKA